MNKVKTSKQLERHFKGIANHWRIEILFLVSASEGVTLDEMTNRLKGNLKTISEHTRKLVQSGLLNKKYKGRTVTHFLSPYGQKMLKLMQTF